MSVKVYSVPDQLNKGWGRELEKKLGSSVK